MTEQEMVKIIKGRKETVSTKELDKAYMLDTLHHWADKYERKARRAFDTGNECNMYEYYAGKADGFRQVISGIVGGWIS